MNKQNDDSLIQQILTVVQKLAAGEFSERLSPESDDETLNAIATGISMLAEELSARDKERRQAEKARQESEEQFRAISESAQDAILMADNNARIIYWNPAAIKIFGYTTEEAIGQDLHNLLAPEKYHQVFESGFAKFRTTGQGAVVGRTMELEGIRKNGDEFPLALSLSSFKIKDKWHALGIVRDITDQKRNEERLKKLIQEKELLLKEVYHRVKNHFQVMNSLLGLQANRIADPSARAALVESKTRIQSMALIHERLYQSAGLEKIDFSEYIESLVADLFRTYRIDPSKIRFRTDIDNIAIDFKQAIPCGLIVNELLSNSFKYAFPSGTNGKSEITIALKKRDAENLELRIDDNGIGLPEGFDVETSDTLGLRLVMTLAEQLDGVVQLEGSTGTHFKITFRMTPQDD